MVGFYALVIVSVSLTLSKAIRDSERSAVLQMSNLSSNKGSETVAAAATTSGNIKRCVLGWVRCDSGEDDGIGGGDRNGRIASGNGTRNRSNANGGYAKTKSLLKKLSSASIGVMTAVMTVVALSLRQGTIAHVS